MPTNDIDALIRSAHSKEGNLERLCRMLCCVIISHDRWFLGPICNLIYSHSKSILRQKKYLGGFKAGTQKIEMLVRQRFPQARVMRMDFDTTRTKDAYEKILHAFANQEADILIGTQMIVKGHDFPNVTLVGVLAADMSLHVPDFHASERTFQLLTQAVGRAGRGKEPGQGGNLRRIIRIILQSRLQRNRIMMHFIKQEIAAGG